MGRWNLEQEYQLLVQQGLTDGTIQLRTDPPDQRGTPRFRMQGGRIAVRLEPEFDVVDLSAGGLAFLSDVPFEPEELLNVVLKDAVTFQGRVVACQVVETDPLLMELRYRVQCRFHNETSGKQLLVLLREMESLDAGVLPT